MSAHDRTPLHEMETLTRFSDRAEAYAKYRPSDPAEAIAAILTGMGEPSQLTAADIRAGTGIAARLLADRGIQVWAIEPNAAMQQAATPHPGVLFQAGTLEQTGLQTAAVDLVTCFQSLKKCHPIAPHSQSSLSPEFRAVWTTLL